MTAGSSGIASWTEASPSWTEGEFVHSGHARVLDGVGPLWAATARLADPRGLHRTAVGLRRGSRPVMREILMGLDKVEHVYLQGESSSPLDGADALSAAGARVETVPAAGHNVMFDDPDAFVKAVAGDG